MFKTHRIVSLLLFGLIVVLACPGGTAAAAAQSTSPPVFRPTATIEEIMRSIIDPAADAVWDSVVTEVTPEGTTTTQPETDDDWRGLRRSAITLVEATNLLLIEGRAVAVAESRSELPGIDLEPEEIASLLAQDRETWTRLVQGLHETSVDVLRAIDTTDIDGLLEAGADLDLACEACHSVYWYPEFGARTGETPGAPPDH